MTETLFSLVPEDHTTPGPNQAAIDSVCSELTEAGLLTGKYVALAAMLKQTAKAVDAGMRAGKISVATAQLNKMLMEGIDALPEARAKTSDAYDTLGEIIAAMTTTAMTGELPDDAPDY